jgi:tRNA(Glu) U13 pseudouridine synthase TruD
MINISQVQYNIALRNVIGDQCHIEMCLKSLKDFGFINYYERHKFGHSVNNHLIGKELLLEHWQEVNLVD